jgi:polysaccharide export outer membrane protein
MKSGTTIAIACATLIACGPSSKTVIEQRPIPPAADTTLGLGDTFDVRIFGEQDLSGTYRVGADGCITMPLAGEIKVDGLNPKDAAQKIAERLSDGILRNPQVNVLVRDQISKKVYLIGQVAKPGTIPYTPSMSVVDAISAAGGFTQLAAKNDTTVTRTDAGTKTIFKIPVDDITSGKAKNVFVLPGDIITVPERIF